MKQSLEASGTEMVTVALRRVNLDQLGKGSLIDLIDQKRYLLLPNTAGCYTADEAIRTARLARELGGWNWVKLEVIGDPKTLFPDNVELLEATETLVDEGFVVLPYTNDDPMVCKQARGARRRGGDAAGRADRLRAWASATPPTCASSSSRRRVPVIVDAGVGTASDAAIAMELGADGVLMNTGDRRRHGSGAHGAGDAPRGRGRLARRATPGGSRGSSTPPPRRRSRA